MRSGGGRRLNAVLRADMVASTQLMAARGVGASIEARQRYADVISQHCAAGTQLESRGDGVMVGFASASAAVSAALAVQRAICDIDDFELRVAVTIDEVSATGGELLPDAERRAAAIEIECPPGDVVVDGRTRRATRGDTGLRYEPLAGAADTFRAIGDESLEVAPNELRAVLFTDLAESAGPAAQRARSVGEDVIAAHDGVVVDTNGGGHVAFFASCADALAAAEMLHERAAASRLDASDDDHFLFRVGLSIGDVVVADGAGFGLAMVEAARLLDATDPGTTMLTADAIATVSEAPACTDVGSLTLKGLPGPTEAVRIERRTSPKPLLDLPLLLRREPTFPLVGRVAAGEHIDRQWAATELGDVRAAVVSGEEGVGKTRLVRELACRVHAEGATVLYGACNEDLRVPYAPIVEGLARAAGIDHEIAHAIETGVGPLGVILGAAGPAGGRAPLAASERDADQFEVFDAVTSAFARLSRERPVLLVVDDVQWGELDTLRMIEHLISRSGPNRLMIVATCRAEHLDRDHPVQVLLRASRPGHRVEHVTVDRLTTSDVVTMLEAQNERKLLDHQLTFAAKLTEITGGNPLYLEELVVHLVVNEVLVHSPERGWSLTVDVDDVAIPDSLIDLMGHRCDRLGPDAVDVLSVAAVMGQDFELDVLVEVTERDLDDVLDIVEAAGRARLIRESENGRSCTFADEISRAAVVRNLRPARRAVVHQRIAETLERMHPHLIDQLEVHWAAAMGPQARTNAVRYMRLAGERDMASAAWEASADRHRRVLELLSTDAITDIEVLGDVHYRLGASLRKVGDESFRPELIRAAELARRTGDAELLARCAFAMMRPGAWYPEAAEVDRDIVAMCEDALLLLAADDPLRPSVLAALATNLTYDEDRDRRWQITLEAQRLAEESGDLRLLGGALAAELISSHEPDRFVRRRELAEEVRRIGRATGDRDLHFTGSWFLVLDMMQAGEMESAMPIVEELRRVVEATREYWPSFLVAHFKSATAIARCDPDALDVIEEERSTFEHHPVDWFGVSVIQQATVAAGRGAISDMLLPIAQAAGQHGSGGWAEKWNYAFCKAYLDIGEHDKALDAIAINPDPDYDNYWVASTYHLGLLGLLLDREDICRTCVEKLELYRGRFATIGLGACISGHVSTSLGQAYLGLRELVMAEELFREAVEQADAVGFPYFATNARRFLAQTLFAQGGRDDEAKGLLETVLQAAERYGFSLETHHADLLLNQLGKSTVA